MRNAGKPSFGPRCSVPRYLITSMSFRSQNRAISFVAQHEVRGPRCGDLVKRDSKIRTPSYLAVTSRGVIPHLSQDTLAKHVSLPGVYVALEDFVEHSPGQEADLSILSACQEWAEQPLRRLIALKEESLLCFGARRLPAVSTTIGNTSRSIGIYTLKGMQNLSVAQYAKVAFESQPDIVVGIADIAFSSTHGRRRREKMASNTEQLITELAEVLREESGATKTAPNQLVLAPILPIEYQEQRWYVEMLRDELLTELDGLAVYAAEILKDLPGQFDDMPRFSFTNVSGPQDILKEVALGVDVVAVPFVNAASDAGIALDFDFPYNDSQSSSSIIPLGKDLRDEQYARELVPVSGSCKCYTCQNHHQAFIHHLLSVREMLAWSLLQIHNFSVINNFFAGIQDSIAKGTFTDDVAVFDQRYERQMPTKTGEGPRLRGYQYRPEGPGEPKMNPPGFTSRTARMAQQSNMSFPALTSDNDLTAEDLERLGLGGQEK